MILFKALICGIISSILFINPAVAKDDYCQSALDNLYNSDNGIISIIKILTSKPGVYLSETETSQDCTTFVKFISVKDPDVIKTDGGFCAVLPAEEIKPGLCALRIKLCVSENDCQSTVIKLKSEAGHYIEATPAYYEMTFD